jgi:hypothetical protein
MADTSATAAQLVVMLNGSRAHPWRFRVIVPISR